MKILLLDDCKIRHEAFKKKFNAAETEFTIVEHANEAIELLRNHEYDLIFLDHDLNGQQMHWDENDCGMTVAKYISENISNYNVIIHSYNAPRVSQMLEILPKAKASPGIWLDDYLEDFLNNDDLGDWN